MAANGELTKYALCCGQVQRSTTKDTWKELYIEHNTIHVRSGKTGQKFETWVSFQPNELTKARAFYKNIK